MKPTIIAEDYGKHNADLDRAVRRLEKSGVYKDLSTIIIYPSLGQIPTRVAASWLNMMTPPNQKIFRLWPTMMEIGEAYSQCIANCLAHPDLAKFKYILTIEADNVPEPDGLLKLLARAQSNPEFMAIGGLYWTKGPDGVPQIWGDPTRALNFQPQRPVPGEIVECTGVANGFTLYRTELFKDERLRRPWFRTMAEAGKLYTQDLYAWEDFRQYGYRCAIDCNVLVGHYDFDGLFGPPDTMW
jgi:hypothetical protein